MPATTPKGYPYPLGTDRLMDGDDAIHNLAQALDDNVGRVAAGQVTVNITTLNTPASTAVTFPVGRFNASPFAVAQYNGTLSNRQGQAQGMTATGCVIWAWQSAGTVGAALIGWIAVQV